ncbi:ribosome-associated translation inhibitor RaiA [Candidatus Saccharibacteria bacterium]|nr:ribosome-associated translation inhibitor RaiA [Candidatus Saccharibacteria bacterium]
MIKNIKLTGIKVELDEKTKKYVTKKIGSIDRYLPKHARKSASAEVTVRQSNKGQGDKYETEVIIKIPDHKLVAKDSTVNILASIDIVEAKIIAQARKYREKHINHRGPHNLLGRFKRSFSREQ